MQRKPWLLALVAAALLSAGVTQANGDFYVVAVGGGVGTKITSVPYTISTPGFYYLGGNLTYSGSNFTYAITVNADDVTLDLMGFSLTKGGTQGQAEGIHISGKTNVEIRNGSVRGFNYGIHDESSGTKHRVINIRATGNVYGISLSGSNHLTKGCNSSDNLDANIWVQSGVITDCVASNAKWGIGMYGPGNVLGNTAFNNSLTNFSLGGWPTAIVVDRNSAYGLATNYSISPGTTGIQWGINAGTP